MASSNRRSFLAGTAGALATVCVADSARAANPTGWRGTGQEIRASFRAHDRRVITIGWADAVGPNGQFGVLKSCYRPDRPVARSIISDLPEFNPVIYTGRLSLGDIWSAAKKVVQVGADLLRDIPKFVEKIVQEVRALGEAIEALVSLVLNSSGEHTKRFTARSYAAVGRDAVVVHCANIRASALAGGSLAQRVARADAATLSQDQSGQLVIQLCLEILS